MSSETRTPVATPGGVAVTEETAGQSGSMRLRQQAARYIPFLALILLLVGFGIAESERFLTVRNAQIILLQSAVLIIVGLGMTFVIIAGSIDLSVGSLVAVAAMLSAAAANQWGLAGALTVALLVGAATGLVNGLVFTVLRVPSFIATLGMLSAARGFTIIYSDGAPIPIQDAGQVLNLGTWPAPVFVAALAVVVCQVIYRLTPFGRYVQGIGGNERVALLSGVPVDRTKTLIFVLSGLMAGLGGLVTAARLGAGTPQAGTGFELDVISAVVIGGTPLTGGIGNMYSTAVGALVISTLSNGLVILGVPSEVQTVIKGIVLVLAVFISLDRRKIGIIK
jgi:ribose/xylose/arabinose/galactoside ABC-type transport system permease subunit